MTFKTSLDANTFYHSLYIQNDIYSKKIMMWLKITLFMIPLAITIPMSFVDPKTDWFIRALSARQFSAFTAPYPKRQEKRCSERPLLTSTPLTAAILR